MVVVIMGLLGGCQKYIMMNYVVNTDKPRILDIVLDC